MRNALALLALLAFAGATQAQTFTVTPASGPGPFAIAWDVPGGSSCAASGIADWTGAVAASGTKSVQPAVGPHTLTLVCTILGTLTHGSVTLHWQPATQNVDGSPYINSDGYILLGEKKNPPTATLATIRPSTTTTFVAEDLLPGTWSFAIKSLNAFGVTSDPSNAVTKVVVDSQPSTQFNGSIPITVLAPPKPKAPVLSAD